MILPKRRKRESFLPWAYLLTDALTVYGCLCGVFWLRFLSNAYGSILAPPDFPVYFKAFYLITIILVFFIRHYGLYRIEQLTTYTKEAIGIIKAVFSGILVLLAITFFIRDFTFSRFFLFLSLPAVMIGLVIERYLLTSIVRLTDWMRGSTRNVLIIGCNENTKRLVQYYRHNLRVGSRVVGFLDDHLPKGFLFAQLPVLGAPQDLTSLLKRQHQIHEVVLAMTGLPQNDILKIICECEKEMVTFRWVADMMGLIASKMDVSYFGGISMLSFKDSPLNDWENRIVKRSLDITVSALLLAVLSGLIGMIAAFIKFTSKGPVFYRQERIGEDGRRFAIVKFRTMQRNAEKVTGPVWATQNDHRRTPLGSFLRRNNLDELPQLWNVLTGDMSLVGPRPERPFFVKQFKEDIPRYMARHSIRSGITGWAQVNGLRGNTSIEERTKYDLYYIENWSLGLDVKILIRTLVMTLNAKSRNAY
ncbi:MAG: undecaprenyl-phosphate glucose phosphotransferase [Candidatus Omnitrophota bacterium]